MFVKTLHLFKYDMEKLGYTLYDQVLNAKDFGIPQKRQRYFLIVILEEYGFYFPCRLNKKVLLKDCLEDATEKYFLTTNKYTIKPNGNREYIKNNNDKIKNDLDINRFLYTDMCGRDIVSKFYQTARVHSENGIAPTLTASNTADNCKIATVCNGTLEDVRIKMITSKEAWRLMGFSDEIYEKTKIHTSETNLYHQAANSIVVDVMHYIFKSLFA